MRGVSVREENGKIMSPMFPRLNVKDADKGGPRAPPRNKMALYEQLSIPSQRFKHVAAVAVPTFSVSSRSSSAVAATAVPSASSSMGCVPERSMHSSYYSSRQTPSYSNEKVHLSSDGKNSSSSGQEVDRRSVRQVVDGSMNIIPSHLGPNTRDLVPSTVSNRRECDDDDFTVPTFVLPDKKQFAGGGPSVHSETPQRNSLVKHNPAAVHPTPYENLQENVASTNSRSLKRGRSDFEQTSKQSVGSGEKFSQDINIRKATDNQVNVKVLINHDEILQNGHKKLLRGLSCDRNWDISRCSTETEVADNVDISAEKNGSASEAPSKTNTWNANQYENCTEIMGKKSESLDNGDIEKTDNSSNSMLDSDPCFDISPDDVVSIIGPKHFWKARRAIVNQQRLFAAQVFELHRLIKVQKLLAASPDLLFEGNSYLQTSSKIRDKINSSNNMKVQSKTVKPKDNSQKANNSSHSLEKTTTRTFPLPPPPPPPPPPQEDSSKKNCVVQVPQSPLIGSCPGNPTPVSVIPKTGSNPWFPHPQGNQWLVPVMSPSEGLVYKPYMGPCPPPGGFIAPAFGGFGPLPMTPGIGDFVNAAYGIPASYQQQNFGIIAGNSSIAPHYFPAPYILPVANPTHGGPIEQPTLPIGLPSNIRVSEQHLHSHNTGNPRNRVVSESTKDATRDSELHGKSASCLNDNFLPSFPASSEQHVRDLCRDLQSRVIKVVPHNPMSATESAARIFQRIQRERATC